MHRLSHGLPLRPHQPHPIRHRRAAAHFMASETSLQKVAAVGRRGVSFGEHRPGKMLGGQGSVLEFWCVGVVLLGGGMLAHRWSRARIATTAMAINGAEARADAAALIVHTKVADDFWLVISVSPIMALICAAFLQP